MQRARDQVEKARIEAISTQLLYCLELPSSDQKAYIEEEIHEIHQNLRDLAELLK